MPLFAQLRRYTLAVIAAAETAADFAAVLFTDAPANGEAQALEPMDVVELEKRMATVLPDGWKLGQVDAKQPSTGYREFKHEILNEIARCLNLPFNVAAGTVSTPPTNAGTVLFRAVGEPAHEIPWVPGQWIDLRNIDLASVEVKGTPGDLVTAMGGTW